MDIEKQREVIRLWNQLRKVEGPVAEEIRIQILEFFDRVGHTRRIRDTRVVRTDSSWR